MMKKINKIKMFSGMVPKLALNLIARQISIKSGLPVCMPPNLVDIKLTSLCNLRCKQCFEWQRPKQGLNTYQWQQILTDIKQQAGIRFVRFYGGEPFCRPDFKQLLSFSTKLGLGILITTNGTLIDQMTFEHLKEQNIYLINISVDGLKPITHDTLRGKPGTYAKAINSVMQLKQYMPVQINTTIMQDNLDEIIDLARWAQSIKVQISFQGLVDLSRNHNRFNFHRQHGLFPNNNQKVEKVMDRLILEKKNNSYIVNSDFHLRKLKDYYLHGPGKDSPGNCAIIYGHVCIRHKGDVFICGYKRPIGNLCRSSLRTIWQSKRAMALTRQMKNCNMGTCKVLRGYHKESFGQWFNKVKTSIMVD
jgi:MoaA/NifB/PqqE/SkfB family radical SAM enzyme